MHKLVWLHLDTTDLDPTGFCQCQGLKSPVPTLRPSPFTALYKKRPSLLAKNKTAKMYGSTKSEWTRLYNPLGRLEANVLYAKDIIDHTRSLFGPLMLDT
ncbi:hypothetical protein AMTR_s00177p00063730 [Amborella trichopoda]|uniref:Uncharacterized protein n=1 Tax=Amborella trichopoda TaxID=13333 RepID=W1PQH9_AMBTC|nr:hypothetical protein AMTR_s00177p00063730 [Amborella trichopoda]